MKPFIYLSVLLITAGSAFGLADYFKEQKKGTFTQLYKEEEEVPEVETKNIPANTPATLVNTKKEPVAADVKTTTSTVAVKKVKKKAPRKPISIKMFTRGDEVEVKEFTPPVIIKEPVEEVKKAPSEPVKEEVPIIKEPVPVAEPAVVKETKKPSLTKLFSRGKPPRKVKQEAVKVTE